MTLALLIIVGFGGACVAVGWWMGDAQGYRRGWIDGQAGVRKHSH